MKETRLIYCDDTANQVDLGLISCKRIFDLVQLNSSPSILFQKDDCDDNNFSGPWTLWKRNDCGNYNVFQGPWTSEKQVDCDNETNFWDINFVKSGYCL